MGESKEAGEKGEGKSEETKKLIAAVHIYRTSGDQHDNNLSGDILTNNVVSKR